MLELCDLSAFLSVYVPSASVFVQTWFKALHSLGKDTIDAV